MPNAFHFYKWRGEIILKNRLIYIIVAAIAVIAIAAGVLVYYNSSNSYVATVAGEKITKEEYTFFLSSVKQQMEATTPDASSDPNKIWTTKIDGKDAKDVAKDRALDDAKEFKIQLIQAKNSKVTLEKADMDKINTQMDQLVNAQGGKTKVEADIQKTFGISLDQYKAVYKDYVLIDKYMQQQEKEIQPSDEDTKKYYNDNMEKAGEITTVIHVLFLTQDNQGKPLPDDKQQEAKKKADDTLAKVKGGQNISDLAKQLSEDPGSKDSGGLYTFRKGEMVKEFEDWAFGAKPGDTGIVKTTYGYHVMKKPTFDDIKDKAALGAKRDLYNKKLEGWKNDKQYDAIKNQKVFASIKVV